MFIIFQYACHLFLRVSLNVKQIQFTIKAIFFKYRK